jgi:hypothetical protein
VAKGKKENSIRQRSETATHCTVLRSRIIKGIVSGDFYGIFMILSYSLDVRQLPLDILFFNFDVFIFKIIYDFFSLMMYPDSGTEFIPNTLRLWEKWRIFLFYFHTIYPNWVFVKRDKLLSQLIKFKYENIKFKQKCEAEHA